MDGINFIQDLAIVLLAAGAAGALCKRIGLSVIVGYLLAGVVIGPFTPPFPLILDVARIETLSQLGLVFLMFAIGLGLSLSKLRQMGAGPVVATGLGAILVLNLTGAFGHLVGWSNEQALFVAAMFMVSSSAVIAKIVQEMNLAHERSGQLALSVTVLEDVVAVVMLAVLGSQVTPAGGARTDVGGLLATLGAFVVLLVMVGLFFMPRLLRRLEARADPEIQTIIVAGVLFLMALMAVKAGYSLALGAFLLGAIVAEMPQKRGVERAFMGLRDMFSSVFFVAIGMMIDVRLLVSVWPWILGLGAFVLVVRAWAAGVALILVGTPLHEARRAALALTPIGEFTFVIAQLGVSAAVLPPAFYPTAVGVSILTVLVAPLINRHADSLLDVVERLEPAWLQRSLVAYHDWVVQLTTSRGGRTWWKISKKRLIQIGLEVLFISGLLIFSERLLAAFEGTGWAAGLEPATLALIFWAGLGLVVLVPLVAIWRNVAVLALIFAEVAARRTRLASAAVETGIKVLSAVVLAFWLLRLLPTESLPRVTWLVIAAGLVGVLAMFSRRLIYWHSEWQSSLESALGGEEAAAAARRHWTEDGGEWNINVQEMVVPERARASGATIAELAVRTRYGVSIAEINRQGHTLIAPEPTQVIYAGDRLLLLGTMEQIAAARRGLGEVTPEHAAESFDEARLETVPVPEGCRTASLADLQIPRHTGVLVAGLNREGRRLVNPPGTEVLRPGDELLVLGAPGQIRAFRRWLTEP